MHYITPIYRHGENIPTIMKAAKNKALEFLPKACSFKERPSLKL
jgi:hypothetical protein